jgi:MarR family transcriptional regulator, temperature-dependent positive regulator of motility
MVERIDPRIVEEAHYRLLALLQNEPELSQREMAERLGVSLGKVNYCMRALIEKGWLKAENFRRSSNKRAYLYKLTPSGLKEKAALTLRFLRRKEEEHDALVQEIARLKEELGASQD